MWGWGMRWSVSQAGLIEKKTLERTVGRDAGEGQADVGCMGDRVGRGSPSYGDCSGSEKSSYSELIMKVELMLFPDGLDVGC